METVSRAGDYDRAAELKAFDETKSGVKGLVDAGVTKLPRIFVVPPEDRIGSTNLDVAIPVVDLDWAEDRGGDRRRRAVEGIREACERWGFFQVVGHAIPTCVMEAMVEGVRRFHEEEEAAVKAALYSCDYRKAMTYYSNCIVDQSRAANWRDSLYCRVDPNPPNPDQLPATCREILMEYSRQITGLGNTLFELISEALGLSPTHLKELECNQGQLVLCHYYPPCPEPQLTIGVGSHSDFGFLSILLQDQIGGLQVRYQDQWVDVVPAPGALVVNLGDLLQLISNDKFKSVEHRVVSKNVGPRISVAFFYSPPVIPSDTRVYGPIKELLSKENPPLYRETLAGDFMTYYLSKALTGKTALDYFRL